MAQVEPLGSHPSASTLNFACRWDWCNDEFPSKFQLMNHVAEHVSRANKVNFGGVQMLSQQSKSQFPHSPSPTLVSNTYEGADGGPEIANSERDGTTTTSLQVNHNTNLPVAGVTSNQSQLPPAPPLNHPFVTTGPTPSQPLSQALVTADSISINQSSYSSNPNTAQQKPQDNNNRPTTPPARPAALNPQDLLKSSPMRGIETDLITYPLPSAMRDQALGARVQLAQRALQAQMDVIMERNARLDDANPNITLPLPIRNHLGTTAAEHETAAANLDTIAPGDTLVLPTEGPGALLVDREKAENEEQPEEELSEEARIEKARELERKMKEELERDEKAKRAAALWDPLFLNKFRTGSP